MSEKVVKTGVSVILIKDGRILVGKRKGSHGAGVYAFPGGHIEASDVYLQRAAAREVQEETGIRCIPFSPDDMREDLFTTFDILSDDGQKVYVTVYMLAAYMSGGEKIDENNLNSLDDKCEKWTWMTLDELKRLIVDQKQKTWIPIREVSYYLKKLEIDKNMTVVLMNKDNADHREFSKFVPMPRMAFPGHTLVKSWAVVHFDTPEEIAFFRETYWAAVYHDPFATPEKVIPKMTPKAMAKAIIDGKFPLGQVELIAEPK